IVNLVQWREHVFARLRQQIAASADPVLVDLLRELEALPAPQDASGDAPPPPAFAVPLQLRTEAGVLSFIGTTTVFGTPVDITLAELALETFFPADAATAAALRSLAAG